MEDRYEKVTVCLDDIKKALVYFKVALNDETNGGAVRRLMKAVEDAQPPR